MPMYYGVVLTMLKIDATFRNQIKRQDVWRVPSDQINQVTCGKACDQGEVGQAEGHQDQDRRLHPGKVHCLRR